MNSKLNRTLHALAGELVTKTHAHEYLRATAEELFRRASLHDVTDEEAKMIAERIRKEINAQRLGIYGARNEGVAIITTEQIIFAKQLQHRLGWSDEYLSKLMMQRYDEGQLQTMPGWKANRLIRLMHERAKNKHSAQSDTPPASPLLKGRNDSAACSPTTEEHHA